MTADLFTFFVMLGVVIVTGVGFLVRIAKTKPHVLTFYDLMERIEFASTETELYHLDQEVSDFYADYYEKFGGIIYTRTKELQAAAKDRHKELKNRNIDSLKPQEVI